MNILNVMEMCYTDPPITNNSELSIFRAKCYTKLSTYTLFHDDTTVCACVYIYYQPTDDQ